jgi:hypothetical protein
MKTLIAALVTAAFAVPLSVQAAGEKASSGSSGSSATQAPAASGSAAGGSAAGGSAASGGATRADSGAEKMFKALDKNQDGSISKEEAKGTPHDKDFTSLDKNRDGKLSREEHAAAPEHAGDKASTGATKGSKY